MVLDLNDVLVTAVGDPNHLVDVHLQIMDRVRHATCSELVVFEPRSLLIYPLDNVLDIN